MDLAAAITLRKLHSPRPRRWWRRRIRCKTCAHSWPCPQWRLARSRVVQLLAEVLEDNRGRHW